MAAFGITLSIWLLISGYILVESERLNDRRIR
jgi:hypothetical protein